MSERCSLWLVPAEHDRHQLRALIDRLSHQLGTTPFEPHVTLLSVEADPAVISTAVAEVARRTAPIVVTAGATTHSGEWRRTLVIELDDPAIVDLATDLAQRLEVEFDATSLAPHLSLTYHDDLGEHGRSRLAAELDVRGQRLTFDALAIMEHGTDVQHVDHWRVGPRVALDG